MTRQQRIFLLTGISIAVAAALFFLPAIAQDPGYHNLSDRRMIAGIPNFGDVVSNAAFLVVGLLGLWQLFQVREDRSRLAHPQEALPLAIAFGGTILIFAGSGYYHWAPDNETLLWDRLPMTFEIGRAHV